MLMLAKFSYARYNGVIQKGGPLWLNFWKLPVTPSNQRDEQVLNGLVTYSTNTNSLNTR